MRKKALRKDFYMEIRKSFGRFLSIFFIVAIGTAFFSGIRAAEPDMRLSGDAYFDQSKLMDLQVISTMGLTADDLQAIREIKGVEQAQPVYSMDALCDVDGSQKVVHIFSSQDGINELKAEKGRMPEKADECVADADFLASSGYQIGDKITFLKDEDTEVTEELTQSTFQIVGSVSSPEYISFSRGSSMIGNGSVSGFISVLPESFQMDAYTEISIQVKGAKEETAFTKEYDNLVDETKKKVEAIQSEREDIRREELMQQMDQKQAELLAEVPPEAMEIAAPQLQQQIEIIHGVQHKKVVCVLDEAHLLEKETLEEFRFLLNYRFDSVSPMAVVLVGQTELWDNKLKLQRYAAIRQRIDMYCTLPHLDRAETEKYVKSHMDYAECSQEIFTTKAMDEIHKASAGIPRMINRVCEKSLMYAFQQQKRLVDDYMVKYVVEHEMLGTVTG